MQRVLQQLLFFPLLLRVTSHVRDEVCYYLGIYLRTP